MFKVLCEVKSESPISFSRAFQSEKKDNESHAEFDERCWRERCHVTEDGNVKIPLSFFSGAFYNSADLYEEKLEGNTKFKKFIRTGVRVMGKDIDLGIKVDDVKSEKIHVPSDGRKGGDKRVWKTFPYVEKWKASFEVSVLNDQITQAVFKEICFIVGMNIGVGRYRPHKGGHYGVFNFTKMKFEEI